jgi:hypothetical protein
MKMPKRTYTECVIWLVTEIQNACHVLETLYNQETKQHRSVTEIQKAFRTLNFCQPRLRKMWGKAYRDMYPRILAARKGVGM